MSFIVNNFKEKSDLGLHYLFSPVNASLTEKKCTAVNNFGEQLAKTLRLFRKHNLIWLTSIHGMFARCSLFTCKLGLRQYFELTACENLASMWRTFSEYVAT